MLPRICGMMVSLAMKPFKAATTKAKYVRLIGACPKKLRWVSMLRAARFVMYPRLSNRLLTILFGKLRPVTGSNGQGSLVEMYERQVYLSHRQARALYEGLGRSLAAFNTMARQFEPQEAKPEGKTEQD